MSGLIARAAYSPILIPLSIDPLAIQPALWVGSQSITIAGLSIDIHPHGGEISSDVAPQSGSSPHDYLERNGYNNLDLPPVAKTTLFTENPASPLLLKNTPKATLRTKPYSVENIAEFISRFATTVTSFDIKLYNLTKPCDLAYALSSIATSENTTEQEISETLEMLGSLKNQVPEQVAPALVQIGDSKNVTAQHKTRIMQLLGQMLENWRSSTAFNIKRIVIALGKLGGSKGVPAKQKLAIVNTLNKMMTDHYEILTFNAVMDTVTSNLETNNANNNYHFRVRPAAEPGTEYHGIYTPLQTEPVRKLPGQSTGVIDEIILTLGSIVLSEISNEDTRENLYDNVFTFVTGSSTSETLKRAIISALGNVASSPLHVDPKDITQIVILLSEIAYDSNTDTQDQKRLYPVSISALKQICQSAYTDPRVQESINTILLYLHAMFHDKPMMSEERALVLAELQKFLASSENWYND